MGKQAFWGAVAICMLGCADDPQDGGASTAASTLGTTLSAGDETSGPTPTTSSTSVGTPEPMTSVTSSADGSSSDSSSGSSTGPAAQPEDWALILLPDTQYYSQSYPDNFYAQTAYIAEVYEDLNVKYVLHEGDIVNNNNVEQWDVAAVALQTLDDAQVPYALCVGNHDMGPGGNAGDRTTGFVYDEYFGPASAYAQQSSIGGTFEEDSGRTENTFHEFTANGDDWLILSLEFGPRDEVVEWANGVVADHPDHLVILLTHAYMYFDETRYDWETHGASQSWNPYAYGVSYGPGGVNDGQELWDELVAAAPGFRFTFNGHVLGDGTGHLASEGNGGNVVHQILANYQTGVDGSQNGGDGYLRIMEFSADGDTVDVRTYSPVLGVYNTEPDQEFTLSMSSL